MLAGLNNAGKQGEAIFIYIYQSATKGRWATRDERKGGAAALQYAKPRPRPSPQPVPVPVPVPVPCPLRGAISA
jgi:hypothetical protein